MRVLRVLLVHVAREIDLRIAFERVGEIERDRQRRAAPGDCPGSVRPDCDTAHTNSIACTTSIAARKPHDAERDPPVEALVPS